MVRSGRDRSAAALPAGRIAAAIATLGCLGSLCAAPGPAQAVAPPRHRTAAAPVDNRRAPLANRRAPLANRRATLAYLRASAAMVRAEYDALGAMAAAVDARERAIASECPAALAYAPRDEAFWEILEEAGGSTAFAAAIPVHHALVRLVHAIDHLRWSDRRLTALVRLRAEGEAATARLTVPNVCVDIAAWRSGAYASLPASSDRYVAQVAVVELGDVGGSREASILRQLEPFEGRTAKRIAARVKRLEARKEKRLDTIDEAAQKSLAAALGVNP